MTTVDRDALIADMTARRPDAVRPTDSPEPRTLTPFAARLHRIARLIADEHLPEASVAISSDSILVSVHDGLVENTVRRWAAAIDEVVTEAPCDMPDGSAGTQWAASGWDSHGVWWFVQGRAPIAIRVCADITCDGELHYAGRRDPQTNEDIETGPCPLAAR